MLDALDALGLQPDGRLLQLNSYENRVHQVFLEDGRAVVTKFYRPGRWSDEQILEEHAFALELAEGEVPVVAPMQLRAEGPPRLQLLGDPPTLARWTVEGQVHRFSVSPRCAGREPELERPGTLQRLGSFIGRLHQVGQRRAFTHRLRMDPAADAAAAIQTLRTLGMPGTGEAQAWLDAAQRAASAIAEALARHGPLQLLRLHGDCHLGNVLWRGDDEGKGGAHVVDLDDACMGPAIQDLWMLVSGDAGTMAAQFTQLLQGYTQWRDFDQREIALVEPLRTLRMLRHSAWLALRWTDPAFPAAFPFFDTPAYWSQQTKQLREQLELMLDAAP